jgi:hypothetical protein
MALLYLSLEGQREVQAITDRWSVNEATIDERIAQNVWIQGHAGLQVFVGSNSTSDERLRACLLRAAFAWLEVQDGRLVPMSRRCGSFWPTETDMSCEYER